MVDIKKDYDGDGNPNTKKDRALASQDLDKDGFISKKEKKAEKLKVNKEKSIAEYSYYTFLIEDPRSANLGLKEFIKLVKERINSSATGEITQDEFDELARDVPWFKKYDDTQEESLIAKAIDAQKGSTVYADRIATAKSVLKSRGEVLGVVFTEEELDNLAELSAFDALTQGEIEQEKIRPAVSDLISGGGESTGLSGRIQSEIGDWLSLNGIMMSATEVARYVESGVFGGSNVETIKADIRKTYMSGAYPAWSDRINSGSDIWDISSPYRGEIAKMLEVDKDTVSFDDPLLMKGLQSVNAEGKPVIVPLYDFKKMIRKDARWDKTDNALDEYTSAGNSLLTMFGLR